MIERQARLRFSRRASWIVSPRPSERMAKTSKPNPGRTRGRRKTPEPTRARLPIRISVDREALNALDKRAIAAQAGIVAGWLASWLVGGSGLLHYVITGLAGSLVGGFLLERFGIDLGIRNQTASRIVTAMIGAIVVVLIARLVS